MNRGLAGKPEGAFKFFLALEAPDGIFLIFLHVGEIIHALFNLHPARGAVAESSAGMHPFDTALEQSVQDTLSFLSFDLGIPVDDLNFMAHEKERPLKILKTNRSKKHERNEGGEGRGEGL